MEEKQKPVFDATASFTINLKREKTAVSVRYPSDDEWAARQRAITTIIQRLSGGATQTNITGVEDADEALLAKIRTDEGLALPEGLASVIIARLNRAEADEPEQTAEGYRIPLKVAGAETVHEMRQPTEKEKRRYQRSAYAFIDKRHGKQELKTSLQAICDFYDLLMQRTEGYAAGTPVPAPHKLAVVGELIAVIEAEDEEEDPADFF